MTYEEKHYYSLTVHFEILGRQYSEKFFFSKISAIGRSNLVDKSSYDQVFFYIRQCLVEYIVTTEISIIR